MAKSLMKSFLFLGIVILLFPQAVFSDEISQTSTITVSAIVTAEGGGTGGGGGNFGSIPTIVKFSGIAYPLSKIFILKNGQLAATTFTDAEANFSASLMGLSAGVYTFSIYGEDSTGRKSSFFSFPIFITSRMIVNIGNIFLSPTIDIDKAEVKKGDALTISGQSVPSSEITIVVHNSKDYFLKTLTNTNGDYLYNLDTSIFEVGKHETRSKSFFNNQTSPFSPLLPFIVGIKNKKIETITCSSLRGDLNCDGHVNLTDFSIAAYWYHKNNIPSRVDLNGDGKVSLIDFSIMAFNWTG